MTKQLSQTGLSLAHELQLDTLCVQFEEAWQDGRAAVIEEYLEQAEEILHPPLLKELLLIELEMLRRSGTSPEADEYRHRFPELKSAVDAAFAEAPPAATSTGVSVARTEYEIISQLSTSREGLSYRAKRAGDGTEVDIVMLSQLDPAAADRVKKRVRLARQLSHPSVTRVLELNLDGDEMSVVLEPSAPLRLSQAATVETQDLSNDVINYGCQLASAVAAGHRLGLAHGSLTPESTRVRPDGNLQIDFVRPSPPGEPGQTASDQSMETQLFDPATSDSAGEPDVATDVYSLSALLVWLFTGEQDQPIERVEQFRDKLQQRLPKSAENDTRVQELCAAVARALDGDPAGRGTAQEICLRLEAIADAAGVVRPVVHDVESTIVGDGAGGPLRQGDLEATVDRALRQKSGAGATPTQIGRFRIVRKIGAGGMGDVYEAEDTSDGARVAIKLLSARILDHPDAVRRFYKEGRLLGEINNPYVTNLVEVNEDAGQHYIAMEYVAGTDLRKLIRQCAPLQERVALSLIADAARGLSARTNWA